MYGVRKCSSFILLQVVDQFPQHHLLKRLSIFHCIFLPPLLKIGCKDMNLSKLQEMVKNTGTWCAAVDGVTKSWL